MRNSHAVAGLVLAGALLSGCGPGADGPGKGGPPKDGPPSAAGSAPSSPGAPETPAAPKVLLTVPSAYEPAAGWQEELGWVPEKVAGASPDAAVTVVPATGTVAYLVGSEEGFAVQAREAATGKVLWGSALWDPPMTAYEGSLADHETPRTSPQIPTVTAVRQDGRDYIVAWAEGIEGKDAVNKGQAVVRLAVYAADASGANVAPLHDVRVPVKSPSGALVAGDGTGVRVTSQYYGDTMVATVDLPTGRITTTTTTTTGQASTAPVGPWKNQENRPANTAPDKSWAANGRLEAVGNDRVLANWSPLEGGRLVRSLHDATTGKLLQHTLCEDTGIPTFNPAVFDYGLAASHDGRYLGYGAVLYDLQQNKAQCFAGDENRNPILVRAVDKRGTMYGTVRGEGNPSAEVDLATGTTKVLPAGTTIPHWALADTGVFLTRGPGGGLLISVLKHR
ncbi:hypothetical protein ABZX75_12890 [Streptomyces sp. NPDC003038]|uniref:hypothetical protein n=1 Tax=unclassified Streptomyces TaxID=2593676 RepID=UPI0033A81AE2